MERYNQLLNFNQKLEQDLKEAESGLMTIDYLIRKKNMLDKRGQTGVNNGILTNDVGQERNQFPPINSKSKGVKFAV